MSDLSALKAKITDKTAHIAQIGLGYVGLPVACMFAKNGFRTTGVDVDTARIETLRRGNNPIEGIEPGLDELVAQVITAGKFHPTTDYNALSDVDVVIIAVQTPVEASDHLPRYAHLRSALASLGAVLPPGALVIIESTVAPGTVHQVVIPALEQATGGKVGQAFHVGHCPERVMPGKLLHNITTLDRVAGADLPAVGEIMLALYKNIVGGTIDVADILTAELVKTTENAYRDVQIAFANEVARICESLGGDVWRVRELVNKSPGRHMLYPGAGVGGHCIPKDPWLLIANVGEGYHAGLIQQARHVNESMPLHVAQLTENALAEAGVALADATITALGYAYLENSDDTRHTPTAAFVQALDGRCHDLRIHDPFVAAYQGDLDAALTGSDAVVILVAHDLYREQNWADKLKLLKTPTLIDARHVLADDFTAEGAFIRVIGKGQATS